jgi:peptide deformylase
MKQILQTPDKVLFKKAEKVNVSDITTPKIQKIIKEMIESMSSQEDGVAIAAPQIGYSLQIFVISNKAFEIMKKEKKYKDHLVFINPQIIKLSKDKTEMEEGCLSVRYLYGKVLRSNKATIKAFDENGKEFTMGGASLLAQIFQHETDHLEGILFTEKANDLKEIPPEDKK